MSASPWTRVPLQYKCMNYQSSDNFRIIRIAAINHIHRRGKAQILKIKLVLRTPVNRNSWITLSPCIIIVYLLSRDQSAETAKLLLKLKVTKLLILSTQIVFRRYKTGRDFRWLLRKCISRRASFQFLLIRLVQLLVLLFFFTRFILIFYMHSVMFVFICTL